MSRAPSRPTPPARALRAAAAIVFALVAACDPESIVLPPEGHVLVHVDTDAPVPPSPGSLAAPGAPPPLFDRLLVEVFAAGLPEPCDGCVRELELDEGVLRAGGSFAVEPAGARAGVRVRLRMYRAAGHLEGDPAPEATVETTLRLPDIPKEGSVDVRVFLPTGSVGAPAGSLDSPLPAEPGTWDASRVGSWAGAARTDCPAPPGPGEVCVPGGAFWMGNPLAQDDPTRAATRQRLVVLSPFYLDAREVTAGQYRDAKLPVGEVVYWSGDTSGDEPEDFCTLALPSSDARDALPMACITWAGARAYCQARGADLPSEAELEYVLGGLESNPYLWGVDPPRCADAVWSRAKTSITGFTNFYCAADLPAGDIGGPQDLASDAAEQSPAPPRLRDRLALPTGVVFDLEGNVAEWARDVWNRQDEPCWVREGPNVFTDPVCETPGIDADLRPARGGSWGSNASSLRAAHRSSTVADEASLGTGLRCARR